MTQMPARSPVFKILLGGVLVAVLGAFLATSYRSTERNASLVSAKPCPETAQILRRAAPLAKGEVAALALPTTPHALPQLEFLGPDGRKTSLAAFSGRTILLNLWATWCVPCRTEMPALERLQAKLGSASFEVVTVNIDQRNLDRPKTFLNEIGVKALTYYADPDATSFQALKAAGKAFGMPTTLIVSPEGCEIASLAGPAQWDSADAVAFLTAALQK